MPRGDLKPTVTEKRRAWLEHLLAHGVASREGWGVVAYQCMHLGWTEWAMKVGDTGEVIGVAEARARFGVPLHPRCENVGEMLTEAGRHVLDVCHENT